MDGLTLLQEARAAGLTVNAIDGRLVVRGPRRAESVARKLIEHKAAILTALARDTATSEAEPRPLPDLARFLPPLAWLTPRQRRLWRERTAFYQSAGMVAKDAETEAMAELVMTGKLCDLDQEGCSWEQWREFVAFANGARPMGLSTTARM